MKKSFDGFKQRHTDILAKSEAESGEGAPEAKDAEADDSSYSSRSNHKELSQFETM